jgi:adenylate cyclase
MVGYTTLAQRNESLALQVLEKHNELVRMVLKRHQGREVKTIGDAFLLEFDSALEALLCAVDVQNAFAEQNRAARFEEMIVVRIGIHVGDVVHRNGDVFGDAVNIASRIVSFADQGGICISEQVYAQVRNKVRQSLVKMQEQPMKNVEQPVDLYRVVLASETEALPRHLDKWNRIAVLPFENISPDPNDSYFADGLTEEIISVLSEVQGLRVIAKTSVNRYKGAGKSVAQIGSELQVAFILEGSVRKAGNKIRVGAQLIEVESQEHVWTSRYDRDLDDIFSIQSDIARQVTDSLRGTLLTGDGRHIERRETRNLTAYVAYLKGRTLLHDRTERAIKGAKEQFELAIREDPSYAKAYSGLADTYVLLGDALFAPVPSSLDSAKKYIDKALELDPNLSEARASLANYLLWDYKFAEAEKEFRRAIALNPSYASAHQWHCSCLEQLGRKQEALAEVLLAEELDPLSSALALSAAYRCVWAGKYEGALERIRRIREIDPTSPLGTEALMIYHFTRRDWDKALTYLNQMIEEDPSDPYLDMDLAYICAVTGKREEALKIIEKLKGVPESARTKGNLIAFVYAGLDDLDECFKWLDYAVENREFFLGFFRVYPLLENVARDPRFSELLRKVNLNP